MYQPRVFFQHCQKNQIMSNSHIGAYRSFGHTKKPPNLYGFFLGKGKTLKHYLLLTDEGKIEFEFIDYDKIVDDTPFAQCPKCQSDMIEKVGYYGCTDPNCDFSNSKNHFKPTYLQRGCQRYYRKRRNQKTDTILVTPKTKKNSPPRLKLEKDTCKIVFDFRKDPGEIKKRKKKS